MRYSESSRSPCSSCCAPASATPTISARATPPNTKLLTQPAISASHVAFIYAGDLFVADLNGASPSATSAA